MMVMSITGICTSWYHKAMHSGSGSAQDEGHLHSMVWPVLSGRQHCTVPENYLFFRIYRDAFPSVRSG